MSIEIKCDELYIDGKALIENIRTRLGHKWTLNDIFDLLTELIRLAEKIVIIEKTGSLKHSIVYNLWEEANKDLNLISKLIEILFPDGYKIKIWIFNKIVSQETLGKWLGLIVDKILIKLIVSLLNRFGWGL